MAEAVSRREWDRRAATISHSARLGKAGSTWAWGVKRRAWPSLRHDVLAAGGASTLPFKSKTASAELAFQKLGASPVSSAIGTRFFARARPTGQPISLACPRRARDQPTKSSAASLAIDVRDREGAFPSELDYRLDERTRRPAAHDRLPCRGCQLAAPINREIQHQAEGCVLSCICVGADRNSCGGRSSCRSPRTPP